MADQMQYEETLQIAQKYSEAQDYAEALRSYRQALKHAQPQDYQEIISRIQDIKKKAKLTPKVDRRERVMEDLRFQVYPVSFSDVIGYKGQKRLMKRIVELPLKKGNLFTHFKVAKSTGVLLYGPPGTGKTLFSKALSGEYALPMKDTFISDILDKLVGGSEKNMRKVFEDARGIQPSIIFFDEVDALGGSRENSNEFTNNDIKNTVNEFLKQLSELHDNKEERVFVICATNLPWLLDPAITRSGRIEHTIFMGPPGFFDRRRLFRYYLPSKEEGTKVNTFHLALATIRYSQADIEKICSGAKRRAIEDGRQFITTHDILKVLRDKTEGTSSLDVWVLKAKKIYIKSEKTITHKTGFLGWRKQKEKIEETGKMSDDDKKIYKPLINCITWNVKTWHISNLMRFVARNIG